MSLRRVWLEASPAEGATEISLPAEESAHLVRSLRARTGDKVALLNGQGLRLEGFVHEANPERAIIRLTGKHQAAPSTVKIILAPALLKAGTMDDLIRTCCEAGAAEIIPLESARSEAKLSPDKLVSKQQRWGLQTVEACKQSGNLWQTHIGKPEALPQWLKALPPCGPEELRLLGSLDTQAQPVGSLNFSKIKKVIWLIGPEGDFNDAEIQLALAAQFKAVTLGPTVLRAENAALACLVATHILTAQAAS